MYAKNFLKIIFEENAKNFCIERHKKINYFNSCWTAPSFLCPLADTSQNRSGGCRPTSVSLLLDRLSKYSWYYTERKIKSPVISIYILVLEAFLLKLVIMLPRGIANLTCVGPFINY
jgi:hypothetical protein